jgi:uracil-DNA glycosylase family 4
MTKKDAQKKFDKLRGRICVCKKCRLSRTRKNAVPGEGPLNAEYIFVGQGPGANEDKTGQPFIGRAGKLLTELIGLAGLKREEVFITSAVKCFPTPPPNRKPKNDELTACRPYLVQQIKLINPKKIVLLGDVEFQIFFPKELLALWRGKWRKKDGKNYFISYHPAAGIRFQKMKKVLIQDFKKLKKQI